MPLMRILHLSIAVFSVLGLSVVGRLLYLEFRPILASWLDRRNRGNRRAR